MDNTFSQHNHSHCISTALHKAETICSNNGAKLTPIRARALALVWQSHQPIGAYDLLSQLTAEGFNSAPPTVYRALDFLQAQGLIHRIASSNTYIGCSHPDKPHEGHFLLCNHCHQVLEIDTDKIQTALSASAQQHGFLMQEQTVEIKGLCQHCQAEKNQLQQEAQT